MEKSKIKLITLPNIITLANLACGSLAIVFALRFDDLQSAFWLLIAAAVLDFLDGFVARLTDSYSEVGLQLDSLCDMVSFGVAPSAILYSIYTASGWPEPWGYAVFIVALFSALRLAKFNVDSSQKDSFSGLPTPANALFIASAGYLFGSESALANPAAIMVLAAVFCILLISNVRMFSLKFKNFNFKDNILRYVFIVLSLPGIILFGITTLPFIILFYIIASVVCNFMCRKAC